MGDPAAPELERAIALAASLDMPAETCRLYVERGWDRLRHGESEDAVSLAEQGIQIAGSLGFRPLRAELLHLAGAARSFAANSRAGASLDEALAESRAIAMPRLEWEILQTFVSLRERHGETERAKAAALRADEVSQSVLGGLPRPLQGLRWCSRLRVVHQGTRKRKLSACAG